MLSQKTGKIRLIGEISSVLAYSWKEQSPSGLCPLPLPAGAGTWNGRNRVIALPWKRGRGRSKLRRYDSNKILYYFKLE